MKTLFKLSFIIATLMFGQKLHAEYKASPVICDPMQQVQIKMEVNIESAVMKSLRKANVGTLCMQSIAGVPWKKEFPVEHQTEIILEGKSDPLSISLQKGLLVTYKNCKDDIVFAFCQLDEDLEGEFPKDVKLCLNPAANKCRIKVLCTQCP